MVDLELDNFQQEKSKNILFKIKTFFINFYNKYRQGLITLGVLALVAYAIVLYSYVTNYFTVFDVSNQIDSWWNGLLLFVKRIQT